VGVVLHPSDRAWPSSCPEGGRVGGNRYRSAVDVSRPLKEKINRKGMLLCSRTVARVAPLRQAAEERGSHRTRPRHVGAHVARLAGVPVTMDSTQPPSAGEAAQTTCNRRALLTSTCALPLSLTLAHALTASVAEAEEPPVPKAETLTSPSGVKYQIIKPGSGRAAEVGDYVQFDYVLRRSNGYFVYSTTGSGSGQQEPTKFARNYQEEPVTIAVGKGVLIKGLDELLVGASAGQRFRALVPPDAGYLNSKLEPQPPSFGPRRELASHSNQPLFFEVEVRKVVSA